MKKSSGMLSCFWRNQDGMVNPSSMFSLVKILFWVGGAALVVYCLYSIFVVGLFGEKKEDDIPQTGIPAIDQPLKKE